MPQLDPTWFASQVFWLAVTFVALYVILRSRLLPPVQAIVHERAQAISGDIEQAQRFKAQAEEARQAYDKSLADARARAQGLINDMQAQRKAQAEETARALDAEIARKLAEASQRIDVVKREMMQALEPATRELTALAVEKLTRRAPDAGQVAAAVGAVKQEGTR